jgi:hypothetical protein
MNDMADYTPLLDDLSTVLRRLHKALIDTEVENFGSISGPYQLLNLVIHHEHFAWLRHLSELMVAIDERRDSDEPIDAEQATAFRTAIESLIGPRPAAAAWVPAALRGTATTSASRGHGAWRFAPRTRRVAQRFARLIIGIQAFGYPGRVCSIVEEWS